MPPEQRQLQVTISNEGYTLYDFSFYDQLSGKKENLFDSMSSETDVEIYLSEYEFQKNPADI